MVKKHIGGIVEILHLSIKRVFSFLEGQIECEGGNESKNLWLDRGKRLSYGSLFSIGIFYFVLNDVMFCFLFLYGENGWQLCVHVLAFVCGLGMEMFFPKTSDADNHAQTYLSNFDIPTILNEITIIMCGIHTMNNIYSLIHLWKKENIFNYSAKNI